MMSLIHWNKSVLSFHLREIIEDGNGSHPLAVAGLSVIAANTLLLPVVMKLGKPVLKAAIKKTLPSSSTASVFSTDASDVRQIWQQAAIVTQHNSSRSNFNSTKVLS